MTIHVTLTATNERGDTLTLSAEVEPNANAQAMIEMMVAIATQFHGLT